MDVNEGDSMHLTVWGPPEGADATCFSVSFSLPEYNILLPKLTMGSKQEVTFKASKPGTFTYTDSERPAVSVGKFQGLSSAGTLIVHHNVPPQTAEAITGICEIRDMYTNAAHFYDADVGKGYAKRSIPGVNDLPGLQKACTDAIYQELIKSYVSFGNKNPIQKEVLAIAPTGYSSSSTCDDSGCEPVDVLK